ncbi:MAG: hypothetical protein AMK71_00370 [Nitrospira bacterium SG8_35_4]|nr:MAG: hypothetical protein AMK71_00370 [Nitrospira bacterium SG8_35_4]
MQEFIDDLTDIQKIRRKLSKLNEQRTRHIFSLVHGKTLTHGLLHRVYKKCGKKRCRCSRGELHGPYPAISVNKNGKQKIIMLKKNNTAHIQKGAKRYRHFQETLARIRKINKEIDYLLGMIKIKTTAEYPGIQDHPTSTPGVAKAHS